MKKYLVIALFAALYSCDDKTLTTVTKEGEATLTLTGNTISMASTRSTSNLASGTTIGVYVLQTSGTTTTLESTPYKNGLYTAGTEGIITSASPFTLFDGTNYSVCAYSPKLSDVGAGPSALPFSHGADVLYSPLDIVTISGETATSQLSFSHKMSQITFTLLSGVGTPDLTNALLQVSGFPASCTMNLADGTITPVVGSGAVVNQIATAKCFVPGALTLNVSVTTTDGRIYTGPLSRTFLAGNAYSYTLTLNKAQGSLGVTGSVVDWVPVSGGNVDLGNAN